MKRKEEARLVHGKSAAYDPMKESIEEVPMKALLLS
jgi:hypothetical protein